jgi:hypothetical protein
MKYTLSVLFVALVWTAAPSAVLAGWTFSYRGTLEGSCGGVSFPLLPPIPAEIPNQSICESFRATVDAISATGCDSKGCCTAGYAVGPCVGSGGEGNSNSPISIPGAEFLPEGSLLRDSPYEHIAGGFNSFGDVSLTGVGSGDAFFTRHYTSSTNDWIAAANQRFGNYLDSNRRHRERFGAGDTPKSPIASPFGRGITSPPATQQFESVYADDTDRENVRIRLQLGRVGPGPRGEHYETLEEMARRRLNEKTGGSMVMNGVPLPLRDPEISVLKEATLADQIKAGREKVTGFLLDNLDGTKYPDAKERFQQVTKRVEKADGVLTLFVTDLADIVTTGITGAVEVLAHGSPGEIGAYADKFAAQVEQRTGQAVGEAKNFVKGEFIDNVSGALGELVKVELSNDMVKATWDTGKKALEDIQTYTKKAEDKIAEVVAKGGDLNAVRQVFKETLEKFAGKQAKAAGDAALEITGSAVADKLKNTFFPTSDHHDTGGDPKTHPDARGERGRLHTPRQ